MIECRPPRKGLFWARVLALLPFVLLAALYAFHGSFRVWLNEAFGLLVAGDLEGLEAWGRRQGPAAALATTLLMIAQALAAPIPAVLVTFTNSLLFGWVLGGILSIASATLAAGICFGLARLYGEPLVRRLVSEKSIARMGNFLDRHGASTVLAARLVPFVPFDPISYLAGLSPMRTWTFVWATFLGQIPAGMAYSYLGQQIGDPQRFMVAGAGLFLALVVLGLAARRVLRTPPVARLPTAGAESADSPVADSPVDDSRVRGVDPPKRSRWRVWGRRLLYLGLGVLLLSGVAWFCRIPLVNSLVARFGEEILSESLGMPVRLGEVEIRESETGLVVSVDTLDLGGGDRASSRAAIRQARVLLGGWTTLTGGLDAVRGVEVQSLEIQTGVESQAPVPRVPASFSLPELPDALPEIDFPVEVREFLVRTESLHLRGSFALRDGSGLLELREVEGVGPVESARVSFELAGGELRSCEVTAEPGGARARGRMMRVQNGWEGHGDLQLAGGGGRIDARLSEGRGELTANLEWKQTAELASLFDVDPLALPAPLRVSVVAAPTADGVSGRGTIEVAHGRLESELEARGDELTLSVEVERFDLGTLLAARWPELRPEFKTSGSLRITGSYDRPRLQGDLHFERGTLLVDGKPFTFGQAELSVRDDERGMRVEHLRAEVLGGTVDGKGLVPLEDGDAWDLRVGLQGLDLGLVEPWLPAFRDLAGRVTGDATITGARSDPDVRVTGSLSNGELVPARGERIRDLALEFEATPEEVTFKNATGTLGGGPLAASGVLHLGEEGVQSLDVRLGLERVLLFRSPEMLLRGTGELHLHGSILEPKLSGDVEIVRGMYHRNIYPNLDSGPTLPFDLFSIEDGFGSRLAFDVAVGLTGGFHIRNNRVRLAPHGEVHLGGTGKQPVVVGSIFATEGTVILPHLRLAVGQGQLTFPEEDPFHPRLEFQGSGRIGIYEVTLKARGDLATPEAEFSSVPGLPREDLLSLVATGLTTRELRRKGVESVAAMELLKVYGPQVWEEIFGQSTGEGFVKHVEVTTEQAEKAGDSDRYAVEVLLNDYFGVASERDHRGNFNLDLLFFLWLP